MKKSKQVARSAQSHTTESPTFFEFFTQSIHEYEDKNPKPSAKSENETFSLYEDLKLLLELSKIPTIEPKHFEIISSVLNRPKVVLKKRYQEYLKHITQDNLQSIYNFIELNGLNGYLIFHIEGDQWQLKDIIKFAELKQTPNIKLQIKLATPAKEGAGAQPPSARKGNQYQLSATSKYDQTSKKIKTSNQPIQLSTEEKQDVQELQQSLKLLSEWFKVPMNDLVQRLYQCSGDLNTLMDVYINKQEHLLWTKEADEALKEYINTTEQSEKDKLKAVLRNDEQNFKRQQWLSI